MAWEKLGTASVGGAIANNSWKELGRTTVSGSAVETITVSGLTAKDNMMVLCHTISSGSSNWIQPAFRFNADTGTNYSERTSRDGAADSTQVNRTYSIIGVTAHDETEFSTLEFANIANQEKIVIGNSVMQNTAGAGNAPRRRENFGKWANTSDQVTQVNIYNGNIGAYFAAGSEVVVLGCDNDEADSGSNFWQELASVELSVNGNLSTGTFTAKKYLWVQTFFKPTSANTSGMVMNNDTGYNYSNRRSLNGAADTTRTSADSLAGIQINGGYNEGDWASHTSFIINKSDKEKLAINEFIGQNTAGASNAPDRMESVGKWANTSNQITEIDITDGAGAALTLTSGSYIKVYGAD